MTVIIPTFNGKELLAKNLPRIVKASSGAVVIVVDDGSTDGTGHWLSQYFPKVGIITHARNHGFAAAVNAGVQAATTDIVVLLNNDAIPHEGWLKALSRHFDDPYVFAVGCREETGDGEKRVVSGRGVGYFYRGTLTHARGIEGPFTLWASGGSAAFSRRKWRELGGMDTLYAPFYWEDIDLSYRAWKRGWRVLYEKRAIVTHVHEQTIGRRYSPFFIRVVSSRNLYLFFWKNITDIRLWVAHLTWLPLHLSAALRRRDGAYIVGFLWACWYIPLVCVRRLGIAKATRSDQEVITLHRKQEVR